MSAESASEGHRATRPRGGTGRGRPLTRALFLVCAAVMLVPGVSPAAALAVGAALALALGNPYPVLSSRGAPLLLKASVVGLGFGLSLDLLLRAGALGVVYTVTVVLSTLALGLWLGRVLRVPAETSLLIASGTGICGGSAIAAVGSAIGARGESMSAALATVFLLNAIALYLFPPVGGLVGLSESQFGVWAAVAIHDTSSVVGAAALYGATALAVATVVKLARALWIVPLTLVAAYALGGGEAGGGGRGGGRAALRGMPWFVVVFAIAVLVRTLSPAGLEPLLNTIAVAARTGLVLTLFLIGAGLTRATLAQVGGRPFAQGVILWVVVASLSLLAVARWVPA
jgi:uncharacterized integral membrane protein (TIGR00698 family)